MIRSLLIAVLGKSVVTSLLGYIVFGAAVFASAAALIDSDPKTEPNWQEITAMAMGLGLVAARDNKVTSEEARSG